MASISDPGNFTTDIAIFLEALRREVGRELTPRGPDNILKDIGEGVARTAKSKLGEYQTGWPQLHESTQSERAELGFPANEPLLRTGNLRASIRVTVHPLTHGGDVYVGSNAPQARMMELGGATPIGGYVPPRPYLAPALVEQSATVAKKVGNAVGNAAERAASMLGIGGED
jgi:hypothetical protein